MSVINVIKAVKQIHPLEIAFVKVGEFYHVYGKDAFLVSYIFGYKLKRVEEKKKEETTNTSVNTNVKVDKNTNANANENTNTNVKANKSTNKKKTENIPICGFPAKILPKIEAGLEDKKINYILLDRRNNYDVDQFVDYKNLNNYEKEFEKAYKFIVQKEKLDNIYNYLFENLQKEETKKLLNEIEKRILC